MEGLLFRPAEGDEAGRCRRHPSAQHRTGGVCPECLHARLLRLCPDCAGERPRGCSCPSTSSVATSASAAPGVPAASAVPLSSLSSSSFSPVAPGSGSVGRASRTVGIEPAFHFHRSRSAAPRRLRARLDEAAGCDAPAPHQTLHGGDDAAATQAHAGGGGWSWLWLFVKAKKTDKGKAKDAAAGTAVPATGLPRSRSVGVVPRAYPPDQDRGSARCKGWSRYLPISMKSFRRTSKVVQARSPSAVAE